MLNQLGIPLDTTINQVLDNSHDFMIDYQLKVFLSQMQISRSMKLYRLVDVVLNNLDKEDLMINKEYKVKAVFE